MQSNANQDNYISSVQRYNNAEPEPLPQKRESLDPTVKAKQPDHLLLNEDLGTQRLLTAKLLNLRNLQKCAWQTLRQYNLKWIQVQTPVSMKYEYTWYLPKFSTGECSYESGYVWSIGTPSMTVRCTICKGCYHLQCVGIKKKPQIIKFGVVRCVLQQENW